LCESPELKLPFVWPEALRKNPKFGLVLLRFVPTARGTVGRTAVVSASELTKPAPVPVLICQLSVMPTGELAGRATGVVNFNPGTPAVELSSG
jgi:hypothetical protein